MSSELNYKPSKDKVHGLYSQWCTGVTIAEQTLRAQWRLVWGWMKPQELNEGSTAVPDIGCVSQKCLLYPCVTLFTLCLCPDAFQYFVPSDGFIISLLLAVLVKIFSGD